MGPRALKVKRGELLKKSSTPNKKLKSAQGVKKIRSPKLAKHQTPIASIEDSEATNEVEEKGLQHGYCIVNSEKRFNLLFSLVKKSLKKKIVVFFASSESASYYSELLSCLLNGVKIFTSASFSGFCSAENGLLLSTGVNKLDIPAVDWIIQYDPPSDPKDFAEGVKTERARSLLFLVPEELNFLRFLENEDISLKQYEFADHKLAAVQSKMEKLLEKNYSLHRLSREAYRSYVLAYNSNPMKEVFNVNKLNMQNVAASFGFSCPPKIKLSS